MEGIDTQMAARVWKRVKAPAQPAPAEEVGLLALLFQSHGLAGLYLGLQRRLTGESAAQARDLYRRHVRLSACLKGMLLASGEPLPGLPPMVAGTGSLRSILEGCFHREQRLMHGLAGHTGDEKLGPVCRLLAEQSAQRAAMVLEILGEVKL